MSNTEIRKESFFIKPVFQNEKNNRINIIKVRPDMFMVISFREFGEKLEQCKPIVSVCIENEEYGVELEPNFGPITIYTKCDKNNPNKEEHYLFGYVDKSRSTWTQASIKGSGIIADFLSGDMDKVYDKLMRFLPDAKTIKEKDVEDLLSELGNLDNLNIYRGGWYVDLDKEFLVKEFEIDEEFYKYIKNNSNKAFDYIDNSYVSENSICDFLQAPYVVIKHKGDYSVFSCERNTIDSFDMEIMFIPDRDEFDAFIDGNNKYMLRVAYLIEKMNKKVILKKIKEQGQK